MSDPLLHSEWLTRKKRIDPRLVALGWRLRAGHGAGAYRMDEYPTDHGPADYALCQDGRALGIVEAKKLSLGPQGVLVQAERYSRGASANPFNYRGYRVPFLYSTNGETIWFHDVRSPLNTARRVREFHTPSALSEMMGRDFDCACQWFGANANNHPRLRPYQIEANTAIEQAVAAHKRQMLVAMATGTGKTFTIINQVYRLIRSGVGKRILFLVDRRALAAQAVRAFASFEPEPNRKFNTLYEVYSQRFQREDFGEDEKFDPTVLPNNYLTEPSTDHAFVYVCTIQRMAINLFGRGAVWSGEGNEVDDDAEQLPIPIHAFDVVVADECHRGYTTAEQSLWRNTLDHFDAIKVGLTATPAAHTKAYFNDVVFRYEYSRAVREGHLVDYDAVKIKSNVRMSGVFLKEGERITVVDPDTGSERRDELEDQREFEASEVERTITSPDSNRKIVEELKRYALEHEQQYGRFPKTLIFAAHDLPHTSHADQIARLAVDIFGRGEGFVRKITGRSDRPLQLIREFRNRPEPGIVVSVDLMSTGVDIPDLEYIVFLRPVKSRILFEQMLGRGTRKSVKYPDKSHFTVFDCFDGTLLQYFKDATAITAEPPETSPRTIQEIIDDIWQNRDRDYNVRCLTRRLQRIAKEMDDSKARPLFEAFGLPDGDVSRYAAGLATALKRDFAGEMGRLRNPKFQELLVNYPRRQRIFIRAEQYQDEVASQYIIRDGLGNEYKPEDYLEAFARFVKENAVQVEAIGILLDRPADWSPRALVELRKKLTTAPEHFTIDLLQKAHDLRYHKALVDVISMVKHAAKDGEPLLTAGERVERAFATLTKGRLFSLEQEQWLNRIREHLVANLSVDEDDFENAPILQRAGGWGKANRIFAGRLTGILRQINEAVAA